MISNPLKFTKMAELQQTNGNVRTKGRQKKAHLRVDFTPMVDMNMLLITFFMLATTMNKPQSMKITMPTNDTTATPTPIPKSKAVTVYLAKNHRVYYFEGEPDLKQANFLKQTNFASNGLREGLLKKNEAIFTRISQLQKQKATLQISESEYEKALQKLKESTSIVLIKPLDTSTYNDMVAALDEMLITGISKYMVASLDANDKTMLKNANIEFRK